jgi:hypothetical protein
LAGDDPKSEVHQGGSPDVALLDVEWVVPDAGAFGRDKGVRRSEAQHAHVTSMLAFNRVDEVIQRPEALALIARATAAQEAAAAKAAALTAAKDADRAEVTRLLDDLTCLVCGGKEFETQLSREDSQWGYTSLKMKLKICSRCGHVMHFSRGRSYWDFD